MCDGYARCDSRSIIQFLESTKGKCLDRRSESGLVPRVERTQTTGDYFQIRQQTASWIPRRGHPRISTERYTDSTSPFFSMSSLRYLAAKFSGDHNEQHRRSAELKLALVMRSHVSQQGFRHVDRLRHGTSSTMPRRIYSRT